MNKRSLNKCLLKLDKERGFASVGIYSAPSTGRTNSRETDSKVCGADGATKETQEGGRMKDFEELNQLFGNSEQAFLVTTSPFSEDAVLIYGNTAAAALTKINMKEVVGRRIRNLGEQWKEKTNN